MGVGGEDLKNYSPPPVGPNLELDPQAEIGARVDPHFVVRLEVKVVK